MYECKGLMPWLDAVSTGSMSTIHIEMVPFSCTGVRSPYVLGRRAAFFLLAALVFSVLLGNVIPVRRYPIQYFARSPSALRGPLASLERLEATMFSLRVSLTHTLAPVLEAKSWLLF